MLLKPGTRVKLEINFSGTPVILYTTVRNCDPQIIELDAPKVRGKIIGVLPETKLTLTEASSGGLLLVETAVVEVKSSPPLVWVLRVPSIDSIRKIERRRDERYEVDLHLRWKKRDEVGWPDSQFLHMINANTSGALIAVPIDLQVGDEIVIDLTPLIRIGGNPNIGSRVAPRCRIVRIVAAGSQRYGLTFENLNRLEKVNLSEAVRRLKSRVV